MNRDEWDECKLVTYVEGLVSKKKLTAHQALIVMVSIPQADNLNDSLTSTVSTQYASGMTKHTLSTGDYQSMFGVGHDWSVLLQ